MIEPLERTRAAPAREKRPSAIPRATVRLQFHQDFTFEAATELVPYFAALGVSHVYASSFLMARPGSTHGYDITDHNRFNPEIGDEGSFERLVAGLHAHGMGLILDFVPNHVGIGSDNPWWMDVLEWGRMSPFARFFDIDWARDLPSLKGNLLLPVLGDHYGNVLERGELALNVDAERGSFSVGYFEHRFPIAVRHYATILRGARRHLREDPGPLENLIARFSQAGAGRRSVRQQAVVRVAADETKALFAALLSDREPVRQAVERAVAEFNGVPGDPRSFRALHGLLERQAYRVAYWRVASDEINYRRFFDINDLAGLRMEDPELFEVSHQLVFRLIAEGKLQGLRLDHVDGLYDPGQYCERLQDRAAYLLLQAEGYAPAMAGTDAAAPSRRSHPLYLLVEKILARHERLREDWSVDGTTGYEFMNLVGGLFVDPAAEDALTELYQRFVGDDLAFDPMVVEAKRQIVRNHLSSELSVLAGMLYRLAQQSWATRDYTLTGVRWALIDVVANFPVYRTYITPNGIGEDDRRYLDWAFAQARKASGLADETVYDFIYAVLTTDLKASVARGYRRRDIVATALKFQQFTGPVTAKAVEDTAFYRYVRLASLNDVGGDPTRFGVSPAAFHYLNQDRQRRFPVSLLATATHDHKRGEDTRVRISAITELPEDWALHVRRWRRINRFKKQEVDGAPAPSRNDEYLLYQMLVGSWPLDVPDPADLAAYAERIVTYMMKAVREAKVQTSWTTQNLAYEAAVENFVRTLLDPTKSAIFLADISEFQGRVAVIGAINGLSQTLLRLTAPGVPDLYQGTEFWDLSLVDPDNRAPVNFSARSRALEQSPGPHLLVRDWRDGRVKQRVIARALDVRRANPALFTDGEYVPLEATGAEKDRVVAFLRALPSASAVVVAPRLVAPLLGNAPLPLPPAESWGDTAVVLPEAQAREMSNVMTGETVRAADRRLPLSDVLCDFPVALLATSRDALS